MERDNQDMERRIRGSRIGSGMFLVLAGLLLLAYKMGAPLPGWIFTWPVLLIGIGLLTGIKSRFHNPGSFILILIGSVFLIDQTVPGIDIGNYIAPIILIGLGILFILRPRHHSFGKYRRERWQRTFAESGMNTNNYTPSKDNEEYIDVHSVLGGVKKKHSIKKF